MRNAVLLVFVSLFAFCTPRNASIHAPLQQVVLDVSPPADVQEVDAAPPPCFFPCTTLVERTSEQWLRVGSESTQALDAWRTALCGETAPREEHFFRERFSCVENQEIARSRDWVSWSSVPTEHSSGYARVRVQPLYDGPEGARVRVPDTEVVWNFPVVSPRRGRAGRVLHGTYLLPRAAMQGPYGWWLLDALAPGARLLRCGNQQEEARCEVLSLAVTGTVASLLGTFAHRGGGLLRGPGVHFDRALSAAERGKTVLFFTGTEFSGERDERTGTLVVLERSAPVVTRFRMMGHGAERWGVYLLDGQAGLWRMSAATRSVLLGSDGRETEQRTTIVERACGGGARGVFSMLAAVEGTARVVQVSYALEGEELCLRELQELHGNTAEEVHGAMHVVPTREGLVGAVFREDGVHAVRCERVR